MNASDELYSRIVKAIPEGIWVVNSQGETIFCNERMAEILGTDVESLKRLSCFDPVFPDDLEEARRQFELQMAGGRQPFDFRLRRIDGSAIWVSISCQPMYEDGGECIGLLGLFTDISERRRAERDVRESEERFRLLADTAPVMVWISGPDKLCTFFNKPWLDFTGRTMGQELGNGWADGVHPEDLDRCFATYVSSFEARRPFQMEYRLRRSDGEYRWILDNGTPLYRGDEFSGYIGSCIDITRSRDSAQRFRSLFENSLDAVFLTRTDGSIDAANPAACAMFGMTEHDICSRGRAGLVIDNEILRAALETRRVTGRVQTELTCVRKDGTPFEGELRSGVLGENRGAFVIVRDITARKRMEETLRERDAIITSLFDTASQSILGVRTDGTIQLANQMAEKMFGYKREELLEQPLEMLVPENSRPRHFGHRELYFENAQSRPMGIGLNLAGRRKDGTTFPVEIGLSVADAAKGKLAVAFVSDVTERKQLDDAVRQREQELKTLLDNVPDAIVRFDREMRYQYVNTVVEQVSGLARETFIGKTPGDVGIPGNLVDLWAKTVEDVFETKQPARIEFAHPSLGAVTEWEARSIPEFASDGSVQSVLCVMRDITERKRLEAISEAHRKEVRALAARLLTAQEEERRRVSRELHDQICQQLASLAIDIGELAAHSPPPAADRLLRLRALQARAVKTSEEARHLAYALHPSVLDDLGLAAALRSLCKEFSTQSPVLEFTNGALPDSLPREIAACLYRITQEALQNATKHSGAKSIAVALTFEEGAMSLSIEDDGVGFDVEGVKGHGGLGLIGMEERARVVTGTISITSQVGRGTQIAVKVPLPAGNL